MSSLEFFDWLICEITRSKWVQKEYEEGKAGKKIVILYILPFGRLVPCKRFHSRRTFLMTA